MRRILTALALGAAPLGAQTRFAGGMELGIGSDYSGGLSRGCNTTNGLSAAATGAARAWRVVVAEASAGLHGTWTIGSCLGEPPLGRPFEARQVLQPRDPSADQFFTTAIRVGLETPPGRATLRLTGGTGRMWSVDVPFRTARAATTIGGVGPRLVLAAERWWYGLPVKHEKFDSGVPVPMLQSVTLQHDRVRATTLRVGFEAPIGRQ